MCVFQLILCFVCVCVGLLCALFCVYVMFSSMLKKGVSVDDWNTHEQWGLCHPLIDAFIIFDAKKTYELPGM